MAKKTDNIEHPGVVTSVTGEFITVEILNKSACAACHAKGVCIASDESIRTIDIPNPYRLLPVIIRSGRRLKCFSRHLSVPELFGFAMWCL